MDHEFAVKSQACEKYLLGELSAELRDAYEEHYFSCADCANELRTAAELLGGSQKVFLETPAIGARARLTAPEGGGWFKWLRPAVAIPALVALLLIAGYQNFVTIPHLKESATPRVLPMFSLISANTRGETAPDILTQPDEPIGLYVDVPADPAYLTYEIRLQEPSGETIPLRSLSYAEAEKTQIVMINPGKRAGKYVMVVLGLAKPGADASAKELARLQFTVEFNH
jgi:hypothetical protein